MVSMAGVGVLCGLSSGRALEDGGLKVNCSSNRKPLMIEFVMAGRKRVGLLGKKSML